MIEAAPEIAQNFSVIHYLDDFFAAGCPGVNPSIYEGRFANICSILGIRIKESKSITGTTADFNGIEFDTLTMETRLPPQKLAKARELVATFRKREVTTLRELQSLTGYLSFCAKVIPVGRSFLRRLFNATCQDPKARGQPVEPGQPGQPGQPRKPGQPITITADMKADLSWWHAFLPQWNGISIIHRERAIWYVWTDASSTKGQGAFFTAPGIDHHTVPWEQAFSKNLSRHHRGKDINFLEMHTVHLAIKCWLSHFKHHRLVVFTDNTTVFHGLSRHSVRGPAMDPLRKITLCAALHDIEICPHWIPTHENTLADLLSRRDPNKLADRFPLLTQNPSQPPRAKLGMPQTHGISILASPASQPATSGGDSAPTPDGHMTQPAEAM